MDDRFVYLCWGERFGDAWDLVGRAKVPLKQLDWGRLEQSRTTGEPIKLAVDMTDKRGRPACGSVAV